MHFKSVALPFLSRLFIWLEKILPRTLTARVLWLASSVLLVVLSIMALVLENAFVESSQAAERAKLRTSIYSLLAAAELENGNLFLPESLPDNQFNQFSSGVYAGVLNADNRWIWQSQSSLTQPLPWLPSVASGVFEFRSLSYLSQASFALGFGTIWEHGPKAVPYTFWIIVSQQSYRAQLQAFQDTLVQGFVVVAGILGLVQFAMLRWGLAPLRRLSAAIVAVEQGSEKQVEGRYPLELQQLVDNMNHLIQSSERQRQKIHNTLADLAHSLKTPLAVVRNELYLSGLRQDIPESTNQLLQAQTERMDNIIQYQLRKVTRHTEGGHTTQKVKSLLEDLLSGLQKLYDTKQLQFSINLDESALFVGDADDLYEILGNLLDNACKYATSVVQCQAQQQSGQLQIVIEDDGAGLNDHEYETVLQRGVRADQRVAGQGIGLAVVSELVTSYHGHLQLGRSELGGLKVTLVF